jgi:hypothetical protein
VEQAGNAGARFDVNPPAALVRRTLRGQLAGIGYRPAASPTWRCRTHKDHTANLSQFAASRGSAVGHGEFMCSLATTRRAALYARTRAPVDAIERTSMTCSATVR